MNPRQLTGLKPKDDCHREAKVSLNCKNDCTKSSIDSSLIIIDKNRKRSAENDAFYGKSSRSQKVSGKEVIIQKNVDNFRGREYNTIDSFNNHIEDTLNELKKDYEQVAKQLEGTRRELRE